jgi:hypothetical protein
VVGRLSHRSRFALAPSDLSRVQVQTLRNPPDSNASPPPCQWPMTWAPIQYVGQAKNQVRTDREFVEATLGTASRNHQGVANRAREFLEMSKATTNR